MTLRDSADLGTTYALIAMADAGELPAEGLTGRLGDPLGGDEEFKLRVVEPAAAVAEVAVDVEAEGRRVPTCP